MESSEESEARTVVKPKGIALRLRREKPSKEKQKQAAKMGYIKGLVAAELASSNPSFNLDSIVNHRRLAELVSAFKTPKHPPYASMIRSAMEKMSNGGGSSEKAISESIVTEFEDLPMAHEAILNLHLGRLCDSGEIRLSDDERYVFATDPAPTPPETKRKKGRGNARLRRGEFKGGEKTDGGDVEAHMQLGNGAHELLEDQQLVIMSETRQTEAIDERLQLEEVADLNDKPSTAAAPELQRRKLRSHVSVKPVLAVPVSEPSVLKQCGTRHSKRNRDTEKTSQAELPLELWQEEPSPLQVELDSETSNQSMRRKLRSYQKEVSVSDSVSKQKSEPQQQQAQHHAPGKRCGRGKPPKLKPDTETELSLVLRPTDSEQQPPTWSGRGRPPKPKPNTKTSLSLVLRSTDSKEQPSKRHGRGRPPKPKPSVDTAIVDFEPAKVRRAGL